ncbi:MAG: TetR/AcrR family transcriptional regulator [Ignavibacteriaceae bacterium]
MEQETKIKVLMAAAELISSHGYHNVSVREICETAGVTKPVLYYYFKDKEDVLSELLNEGHKRFKELFDKHIKPDYSFEESLDGLLTVYKSYAESYPHLIKVNTYVQLSPLPQKIKSISKKKSKEVLEKINSVFSKGIIEKYFDKNVEQEMLVYSFIAPIGVLIAQNIIIKNSTKPLKDNLKKYFKFWKSQFIKKGK